MNHRGHPKKPIPRTQLPLERIAAGFLRESVEEAPDLVRQLGTLNELGMRELGGVLGRFDSRGRGELDARERLLARRVLGRLHKPGVDSLVLTNKVLDYLDLDMSALIEEDELELCVEIIERFCCAGGTGNRLTSREIEILYAVLRHLDKDGNGQLDAMERQALRKGLGSPQSFMEEHRKSNPHIQRLLAQQ